MTIVPILIGSEVVERGNWVGALDALLLTQFTVNRLRHRKLCPTTINAIATPHRAADLFAGLRESDPGLDGRTPPVSVLLHTNHTFTQALTTLSLFNEGKGPLSARVRFGAAPHNPRSLFLFLPVTEVHSDVMRKLLF